MQIVHQQYTINFTAETTMYENEVQCTLSENDFNYTQNPTAASKQRAATEAKCIMYVSSIGGTNNKIQVYVNDPVYGTVLLGEYLQQASDSTTAILAASIANALSSNVYGYTAVANSNQITITARLGLGVSMNGSELTIIAREVGIFDDTFDDTFN